VVLVLSFAEGWMNCFYKGLWLYFDDEAREVGLVKSVAG
jgi:hypothetical protein